MHNEWNQLLPPGLYLIEVTPTNTLWVSIPNDARDQAMSLTRATDELMKPALAALRAIKEDSHGEAEERRPAAQTD